MTYIELNANIETFTRLCDAKNLALSPLCNLDVPSLSYLWSTGVKTMYKEPAPHYVTEIPTTKRKAYKKETNEVDYMYT